MNIGDVVEFGRYKQFSHLPDSPLEWIILDIKDDQFLLLTKNIITGMDYHGVYEETTWANCDLRKWCNNDFYYTAFSAEERNSIVLTHNDNRDLHNVEMIKWEVNHVLPNVNYRTFIPCNYESFDTLDKIFMLSVDEATRYKTILTMYPAIPTQYASKAGVSTKRYHYIVSEIMQEDGIDYCERWWLRTRGKEGNRAAHIADDGSINESGFPVFFCKDTSNSVGIRPAMWVQHKFFD